MRRSREDAAETRRQIVDTASRLFRARGIASVSIADIMGSLGLTVGGFYRHFESREALVAEALEAASFESVRRMDNLTADEMLASYLSSAHRAGAERGCPVAALCSEVGHESRSTKQAFTKAVRRLLVAVSEVVDKDDVLHTAATVVGALVLARATDDDALADDILAAVRDRERRAKGRRRVRR